MNHLQSNFPCCKNKIIVMQYTTNQIYFNVYNIPSNVTYLKPYFGDYKKISKKDNCQVNTYATSDINSFIAYAKDAYLIITFHANEILREHKSFIQLYEPQLKIDLPPVYSPTLELVI